MNNSDFLEALSESEQRTVCSRQAEGTPIFDELVSPDDLAKELQVTTGTLAVWRSTKRYNIPYLKIGSLVRYLRPGIEKWKLERTHGTGPNK